MDEDLENLIGVWHKILTEDVKTWVMFKNGTIVVCSEPDKNPRDYAINLMKTMGFVAPGSSHGDFSVNHIEVVPGWVVECHHPDILNYVNPSELEEPDSGDMIIGLHGRQKRGEDAQSLEIVHIEQV
jgi:hypothetical protein